MIYTDKLESTVKNRISHLVVGLDPVAQNIPHCFRKYKNPVLEFNKAVIDAAGPFTAGFKVNLAFYECDGVKGAETLQETAEYIPSELIRICDAKRSDIENTSEMYARAYFDNLPFDSITINPYMGIDGILPFTKRRNKFVYVLLLTSNKSAKEIQYIKSGKKRLFEIIAEKIIKWGNGNTGFVIGANHLREIKKYTSDKFDIPLLIPGIGAQKNSLKDLLKNLKNDKFLINSSRGIIYSAKPNCTEKQFRKTICESVKALNSAIFKGMRSV